MGIKDNIGNKEFRYEELRLNEKIIDPKIEDAYQKSTNKFKRAILKFLGRFPKDSTMDEDIKALNSIQEVLKGMIEKKSELTEDELIIEFERRHKNYFIQSN